MRRKCLYSELFWSAFPAFGLNTDRHGVSLLIQYDCGKIWTRITPNTYTFYAVILNHNQLESFHVFKQKLWCSLKGNQPSLCEKSFRIKYNDKNIMQFSAAFYFCVLIVRFFATPNFERWNFIIMFRWKDISRNKTMKL